MTEPEDQVTPRDRYHARTAIVSAALGAVLTAILGLLFGGHEWKERSKEIHELRSELANRDAAIDKLNERLDVQVEETKQLKMALNSGNSGPTRRSNGDTTGNAESSSHVASAFEGDVIACHNHLPRGGLASPPSYGDLMLGGDNVSLDGRIVDIDLANRQVAVDVELPRGIGVTTLGVDAATKVYLRCDKGSRESLKCGHYVRVMRVAGSAAAIVVMHNGDMGQQLPCEIRY